LYGGSARIIAHALIDSGISPTPKTLFLIDPCPQFTPQNKAFLADKSSVIKQSSPEAFEIFRAFVNPVNFAFLDGDHSEEAVRDDICGLYEHLNTGAYVLCHDAFNEQTCRGIDKAIAATGLTDCGLVATTPQKDGSEAVWGGLRLLRRV